MTAVTPGREDLIASVASSLEGRSFAYTQGEHHRKFAQNIVDEVIVRLAAKPDEDGVRARADQLITTKFDEVLCKQLANCGWPECECPRSANHSPEAVAYAFTKARELLVTAGFEETAAILYDCRPALSTTGKPKP